MPLKHSVAEIEIVALPLTDASGRPIRPMLHARSGNSTYHLAMESNMQDDSGIGELPLSANPV